MSGVFGQARADATAAGLFHRPIPNLGLALRFTMLTICQQARKPLADNVAKRLAALSLPLYFSALKIIRRRSMFKVPGIVRAKDRAKV